MLKRKITQTLLNWKNSSDKPCLLIKGARQVGKTYIINDFAKNNYKSYIYINFELMPDYKKIFEGNLDIESLKMRLQITFPNIKLIEKDTIIFLDEIQACPKARVALKTFALDKSYDVIASGSLLGLYYKEVSSYPVGYEKVIELYSLDFEEFLWSIGISSTTILDLKKSFENKESIDEYVLNSFNEYFKIFKIIGGMPRVVDEYVNTKNLSNVYSIKKGIIDNYLTDVIKYASTVNKQKIINTFNSIPIQLAKKNKKFLYNEIDNDDENSSSRKYSDAISWLKDAGIVNFCYNLSEPASPLISNIKLNSFKIYMRDTGLLLFMYEQGVSISILNSDDSINEGAITENVCASEICNHYEHLTYFEKKSKLELNFILNINGVITAVEIKSGNNEQAKSLKSIIENYKTVKRYIKLEKNTNIYVDDYNIEHYPLFMVMFL